MLKAATRIKAVFFAWGDYNGACKKFLRGIHPCKFHEIKNVLEITKWNIVI